MPTTVATPLEAVAGIRSRDNVWIHSMAATPLALLEGLVARAPELTDVQLLQMHLEQAELLTGPALDGHLRNRCYFAGSGTRELIQAGRADYVPLMLSEIPKLLRRREQKVDVALIQVSPPDRHGACSLGVSVEATRAACEVAGHIIAQVNPRMPRTHGDAFIPFDHIDVCVEVERALPERLPGVPTAAQRRIGELAAALIDDGDCLQLGIGEIPDAVLAQLGDRRDLGVHTEMFADGLLPLLECGAITNARKRVHPGKIVTGFVLGSQRLYDFVDDNPEVVFLDIEYVNSINTISRNANVVSVNSALQVDLTGQVCADSLGSRIYSGVGGQLDFVLGAGLSTGGRSIIAMPATAAGGRVSRIVPVLNAGGGVVTPRANVHYVVTEFGVASLRGRSLRERARALIEIAHPDFREQLSREVSALTAG